MSEAEPSARGGRARATLRWLSGRTDTPIGRLSLLWFRRYFEASNNSASAATVYSFLSVFPTALVGIALFRPSGDNAFADRLINHLGLHGATASLVQDMFGSASSNKLAASITVVISFLIWGLGLGQIFQDVYKRGWRIEVGSVADQGLFAIFFFVLVGVIALGGVAAEQLRSARYVLLIPVWLIGSTIFWLWVPSLLLHRKIRLRPLLPGAILAAIVIGGLMATSPLFIAAPVNFNGKAFGSFGVVVTMLGYVFIAITVSLVCAVFSPVWAEWRRSERELKEQQPSAAGDEPGENGRASEAGVAP